eukprot:9222987-Pyramimonas_sp.AAC.1
MIPTSLTGACCNSQASCAQLRLLAAYPLQMAYPFGARVPRLGARVPRIGARVPWLEILINGCVLLLNYSSPAPLAPPLAVIPTVQTNHV